MLTRLARLLQRHLTLPRGASAAISVFAIVATSTTLVSGCTADTSSQPMPAATSPATSGVRACAITDTGGIDDRTLNQSTWEGFQRAQSNFDAEVSYLISTTAADYAPNLQESIDSGCDLIISVGSMMAEATAQAARAHPDIDFVAIDATVLAPPANLRPVSFDVAPPSFLAGYLAAATSTTGVVATWGGIDLPPVRALMAGFRAGVAYFNQQHAAAVAVLGWDGTQGVFVGSFGDPVAGGVVSADMVREGADVIFPVAGASGLGAGDALRNAGRGALIWVDTDGYHTTEFGPLIVTSVLKNADKVAYDAIADVVSGTFTGGQATASLANAGVGLAPFHDFEDDVPPVVRADLATLTEDLIAGRVSAVGS